MTKWKDKIYACFEFKPVLLAEIYFLCEFACTNFFWEYLWSLAFFFLLVLKFFILLPWQLLLIINDLWCVQDNMKLYDSSWFLGSCGVCSLVFPLFTVYHVLISLFLTVYLCIYIITTLHIYDTLNPVLLPPLCAW